MFPLGFSLKSMSSYYLCINSWLDVVILFPTTGFIFHVASTKKKKAKTFSLRSCHCFFSAQVAICTKINWITHNPINVHLACFTGVVWNLFPKHKTPKRSWTTELILHLPAWPSLKLVNTLSPFPSSFSFYQFFKFDGYIFPKIELKVFACCLKWTKQTLWAKLHLHKSTRMNF